MEGWTRYIASILFKPLDFHAVLLLFDCLAHAPSTGHLAVVGVTLGLERFASALLPRAVDVATVLPKPLAELAFLFSALVGHIVVAFLVYFSDVGEVFLLGVGFGVEVELVRGFDVDVA